VRLLEKQKARWYYGVSEQQFRRAYDKATRMSGVSGENLLRLMELRMDNVVFRMGFTTSRPQARQLVVHGHFLLNGRKHNIPSAVLSPGDVLTVREKSRSLEPIVNAVEQVVAVPSWLEADHDNFTGRILHTPGRDEIDTPVEEQYIIEFYSR
jgi:small subunit ribosomal protein S4